jgi:hypothetical protein
MQAGAVRLAFGLAISAALGTLVGGVLYVVPRLTWLAWVVGQIVALGHASTYFDVITRHLEWQAQQPRETP